MSNNHLRRLLIGVSAASLMMAAPALAQDASTSGVTQLEGIVIVQDPTVASPIEDALEQNNGVAFGQLVVVDDAFVPVTIATEREIIRQGGANLGDVLDQRPGIIGSTFAPGANRPVIRGLDNFRVRVQENGIGSHDVSALSEDHVVPIDPFATDQIEVIRGPATLRYGSQAIGGVVAAENGRIPTAIPKNGFSGKIIGDYSSVDRGRNGGFKATAGANGVAIHADGFVRRAEDYDTPQGEVFNSFVETESGAIGGSLIGPNGFVGVSISRFQSVYGLPGEEAAELEPRVDLLTDRIQARGELEVRSNGIEAVRFWFGATDYEHFEIVTEDGETEVGQQFINQEIEGRVEVQHVPFTTSAGVLSGAIGVQLTTREQTALIFEGDAESLLEPSETDSVAAFLFEELEVSPVLKLQGSVRVEHTEIDGTGRLDPLNAAAPRQALSRDFTAFSIGAGGLLKVPGDAVVSLNTQYVERAPDAAELFSAGVHEATETFEIGDPDLDVEKAFTVELGWRKATGPLRFDTTAYYTRFNGFIFKQLTGLECGETLASCGEEEEEEHAEEEEEGHGHGELNQVLFQQRDANFFGVEIAAQYDVAQIFNGVWGVEGQYDFVHARFDEGGNVPRIPPHRLGGGLFYRDASWLAKVGVLHAFDQTRFGENEEETPGYTLVTADVSYTTKLGVGELAPLMTIGVRGENLADDEVMNHVSFRRDILRPGASVKVYGSVALN